MAGVELGDVGRAGEAQRLAVGAVLPPADALFRFVVHPARRAEVVGGEVLVRDRRRVIGHVHLGQPGDVRLTVGRGTGVVGLD